MKVTIRVLRRNAIFNSTTGKWKCDQVDIKKNLDLLFQEVVGEVGSEPQEIEEVMHWVRKVYPNAEYLDATGVDISNATGEGLVVY